MPRTTTTRQTQHNFEMQVEGTFAARISPRGTHCGLRTGANAFRYHVHIRARSLDAQGFVVDNAVIKNYFEALSQVDTACEGLCERAVEALWRDNFISIAVRIWGADWASVTCQRTTLTATQVGRRARVVEIVNELRGMANSVEQAVHDVRTRSTALASAFPMPTAEQLRAQADALAEML